MNFYSIKSKLLTLLMLATAISTLLITAAFTYKNIETLEEKLNYRIETLGKAISINLGTSLLFKDKRTALEILESLKADPSVLIATIKNTDDGVFVSYHKDDNITNINQIDKFLSFSNKIYLDNELMGELIIYSDKKELEIQQRSLFFYAFVIASFVLLIVFIIASYIQKSISDPIIQLNDLIQKVGETKDYSLRSANRQIDEIGQLSRRFNSMLEQIEHRDTMLEKQVAHRTAELEQLANDFRHRAYHDALTNLPNRAYLNEYGPKALAKDKRNKRSTGLLLLDIDNFKVINDTLGHDFGDELIKLIATRLQESCRAQDTIVRLGGDEFVVLIENIDNPDHIHEIAEKILKTMRKESYIKDQRILVTTSIGCAICPEHGDTVMTLKKCADLAMYVTKDQGKNGYSIFEQSMEHLTIERLIVQNNLRNALDNEELKLVYQPKIDASNNSVIGCEILVRWYQPEHGVIFPDSFIPFAEENGLIKNLDIYVLERACQQAKYWRDNLGLEIPIAVNFSGIHFHDHEIVSTLGQVLNKTNMQPHLLQLEITEAMLIQDPEIALEVLLGIRELGIKINLDDFGIGYSSLNYLRTLPVDIIKLDKSFVIGLVDNPQDERLTRAIIALAKELELSVIAEGVETTEHVEKLKTLGCLHMQGYHFAKPLLADDFIAWVNAFNEQHQQPS